MEHNCNEEPKDAFHITVFEVHLKYTLQYRNNLSIDEYTNKAEAERVMKRSFGMMPSYATETCIHASIDGYVHLIKDRTVW